MGWKYHLLSNSDYYLLVSNKILVKCILTDEKTDSGVKETKAPFLNNIQWVNERAGAGIQLW